jgi:hypothetical protein
MRPQDGETTPTSGGASKGGWESGTAKALALLAALLGAGAGVAALQGWRQVTIALLVVAAGAAALRSAAIPTRRLPYGGAALAAAVLAVVLIGTQSSDAPQTPAAPPNATVPSAGPDENTPTSDPTGGSPGQDEGTEEPLPCRNEDGADVSCTATGAALALTGVATCSREGVTATWGLDPEMDNLLIDTVAASDGETCLATPNATARAAGATARDLGRAQAGTVTPALRVCARRDGTLSVACSEPHELEFIGPWRTEPPDDATRLCRDAAVRYTGANLSEPGQPLSGVALRGQLSTGEQRLRCAVVADRALQGSVRSLGSAEVPFASD